MFSRFLKIVGHHDIENVFWLMILQGLTYLFPLVVYPYLANVLGAGGYGIINFALSMSQTLVVLVDFGFNLSATKNISLVKDDKEAVSGIFIDTLVAKFFLLGIAFVLLLMLLSIGQFAVYRTVSLLMFGIVVANVFSFTWLYQGLSKMHWCVAVQCIGKILIIPLVLLFVKNGDDVISATLIMSFAYIFPSLLIILLTWRLSLVHLVHTSISRVKKALSESVPVFIAIAISALYSVLFPIVLGYFSTEAEVGIYGIADKIMRAGTVLFLTPCIQVFFPIFSRMRKEQSANLYKHLHRVAVVTCLWMVCIGVVLFFFSDAVINLLGKDYAGSVATFKVMAFIPFMVGCGAIFGQLGLVAIGSEKEKKWFRNVYFIASLIAFVSVFIYRERLNAYSLALILLITESVVAFGMTLSCRISRQRQPNSDDKQLS